MTRREAIAKATVTTADTAAGMLEAPQGRAFVKKVRDQAVFGRVIRQEIRGTDQGETNTIGIGSRLIRGKPENTDDGYRAGITTGATSFTTTKVWLPWEVTEDVFHGNIEGEGLESTIVDEMTTQFGVDLDDLDINGDTAAGAGPDQAFLQISDGIIKKISAANVAGRHIDASLINAGTPTRELHQAMKAAMPNKYFNQGGFRWLASPAYVSAWEEYLTDQGNTVANEVLANDGNTNGGRILRGPLGIPFIGARDEDGVFVGGIPSFPDNYLVLAQPRNFTRVVSWQVRKRKVTGETDSALATRDKRFYCFFIKRAITVEELDAVVFATGVDV